MKILFMCVANSARSQLAEGLAKNLFPNSEIHSAGSHPGQLNPFAVEVMSEIGLDISKQYSKSVDEISPNFLSDLDYVITLCAEEVCPTLVSKAKKLHWPLPDPASKENLSNEDFLNRFRGGRDALIKKLQDFKGQL